MRSLFKRRPSAPMVVSLVALFMSLGGVGYAATALPRNSVGNAQLRNNAVTAGKIKPGTIGSKRLAGEGVTYTKIHPGAVGKVRANLRQLQARLASTCATGSAVGSVDVNGKVTCNPTAPPRVSIASASADLAGTPATVASGTLPAGGSYLALANPTVAVTGSGTAQRVTVTCTLTVGTATQTRATTIDTGTSTAAAPVTIPLQQAGAAGPVSVACSDAVDTGTAPTVHATTGIEAIQTAS